MTDSGIHGLTPAEQRRSELTDIPPAQDVMLSPDLTRMLTRRIDIPQAGWFKVRLRRRGPYVGACIVRECSCTVNGTDTSAPHEWSETCDRFAPLTAYVDGVEQPGRVQSLWLSGFPIDRGEHDFMVADAAWAREYATDEPKANPTEFVDVNKLPSIF